MYGTCLSSISRCRPSCKELSQRAWLPSRRRLQGGGALARARFAHREQSVRGIWRQSRVLVQHASRSNKLHIFRAPAVLVVALLLQVETYTALRQRFEAIIADKSSPLYSDPFLALVDWSSYGSSSPKANTVASGSHCTAPGMLTIVVLLFSLTVLRVLE